MFSMTGVLTCPYPAGLVLEATSHGKPLLSSQGVCLVCLHLLWSLPTVSGSLGRGRWVPVVSTGPACSRPAHTCGRSGQRSENEHNRAESLSLSPYTGRLMMTLVSDSSPLYAQHSQGNFQKDPQGASCVPGTVRGQGTRW